MPQIPAWLTREELLARGVSDAQLRRWRDRGECDRLRQGRYLIGERRITPEQRHLARAMELGRSLESGGVISHTSAALVHELPVPDLPLDRVHITWPGSPGRRPTPNIRPHRAYIDPADVVQVEGIAVTSAARTIYDLARSRDVRRRSALAVADAACNHRLCTPDGLCQMVEGNRGRPGCGRARPIVAFADARSESVGESYTRAFFGLVGTPEPELQVEIGDDRNPSFARADFLFFDQDTVAEFDGAVKYAGQLRPGETPADAVVREKLREDRIRDRDFQVVRFIWSELGDVESARRRLDAAFSRAGYPGWRPGPPRFLP